MIACRSLLRVDRAFILANSYLKSKPCHQLQEHVSLSFMSIDSRTTSEQGFMDQKRKEKVTTVWRTLSSSSAYAKCPKEFQVESEELHMVDGEKVEVSLAIENEAKGGHEKSEAEIGSASISGTSQGNEVGEALESGSVPSDNKLSISLKVGASLMRFIKGKWGSTQKKIEEEFGVRIIFPPSRNEDFIVIKGTTADSITRASEKIHSIIDEAVNSPNLDYSHFVSLPLAIHPKLVEKLVNFQMSILVTGNLLEDENPIRDSKGDTLDDKDEGNVDVQVKAEDDKDEGSVAVKLEVEDDIEHDKVDINKIQRVSYAPKEPNPSEQKLSKHSALSDMGIEESIFIKPATFHLTVLMLKLWNKDRVAAAAEVLQSVASKVKEALDNRPVSIRLKGLKNMKGSFAKARVVYAPVEEIGSEGRLERACQVIIDAFVEAGLVLEKDTQSALKLHATVMNARHRKRTQKTKFADSFDARGIFKKYGSEEWGEYLIPEAHLSQRFMFDENGYYHCCSSINFPKSMQLD